MTRLEFAAAKVGELSLLLGQPTSVNAVAADAVTVIEVQHTQLMTLLRDDVQSGRLFKVIATYLSSASPSSRQLRQRDVPIGVAAAGGVTGGISADVAKARQMFQPGRLLVYQCSVRRRLSAVKEARAQFGAILRNSGAIPAQFGGGRSPLRPPSTLRRRTPTSSSTSSSRTCASTSSVRVPQAVVLECGVSPSCSSRGKRWRRGRGARDPHDDSFDEAIMVMEALRLQAKTTGSRRTHRKRARHEGVGLQGDEGRDHQDRPPRQEDEARARHGPEGGGLAPLHGGRQATDVPQGGTC